MVMRYEFEWNIKKAKANIRKHGISFDRATTIFRDPHCFRSQTKDIANQKKDGLQLGRMKAALSWC